MNNNKKLNSKKAVSNESAKSALKVRTKLLIVAAVVVAAAVVVVTFVNFSVSQKDNATPEFSAPDPKGIAGFLFQDRNNNGMRDSGERPVVDVKVDLYSTGPLALTSTMTNSDGVFYFPDMKYITPGQSTVRVMVQPVFEGPAAEAIPKDSKLSQLSVVPIGGTATIAVKSYRLCLKQEECPGLKLPDLTPELNLAESMEYPSTRKTAVDTTTLPGKVLLRFPTAAGNTGGLLDVVASTPDPASLTQKVSQVLLGDGVVFVHPAGTFVYHPEHKHFHMAGFEKYELLDGAGSVVATSEKVSFCLTDILPLDPKNKPNKQVPGEVFINLPPLDCGEVEQGINSGFADYYGANLPDQWIDVTNLPSGKYKIRVTVNPENVLIESDTKNNAASFDVEYVKP